MPPRVIGLQPRPTRMYCGGSQSRLFAHCLCVVAAKHAANNLPTTHALQLLLHPFYRSLARARTHTHACTRAHARARTRARIHARLHTRYTSAWPTLTPSLSLRTVMCSSILTLLMRITHVNDMSCASCFCLSWLVWPDSCLMWRDSCLVWHDSHVWDVSYPIQGAVSHRMPYLHRSFSAKETYN